MTRNRLKRKMVFFFPLQPEEEQILVIYPPDQHKEPDGNERIMHPVPETPESHLPDDNGETGGSDRIVSHSGTVLTPKP